MEYTNKAYLLIGGNVGNTLFYLEQAVILIQKQCGNIIDKSSIYKTAPWGNTNQASFLNQVLVLNTGLESKHLIPALLDIEEKMGRVRREKYGPRIIDLDILLFNQEVHHTVELTIPHKELQNRRFVLEPLVEIAPLMVHPVLKKTMLQLLGECSDTSKVEKMVNDD